MTPSRFQQIALIAALGLTAGCAGSGPDRVTRSATVPTVLSGVTTPGQAYLRELTIGAADGMRLAGWRDRKVQARVEQARDAAELFRFDMSAEVRAAYDGVREAGYAQGLFGAWDPEALNGYLDVVEAGNTRFVAIEGAGHSDHAWATPLAAISGVTGAISRPLSPDRFGHEVIATALASEINEASLEMALMIERSGEDRIPAVEMGDRLRFGWAGPADALAAYAEVLPVGPDVEPDAPGM